MPGSSGGAQYRRFHEVGDCLEGVGTDLVLFRTLGELISRDVDKFSFFGELAFEACEMACDLLGCEEASSLGDEPWQIGSELAVTDHRRGKCSSKAALTPNRSWIP